MSSSVTMNKAAGLATVNDAPKLIEESIVAINAINKSILVRNQKPEDVAKLKETFTASVEQLTALVSSSLVEGLITSDKYNILQAKTSNKTFKNCSGHVNSIIKKYLAEKSLVPAHQGSEISTTELAKLVAEVSPFAADAEQAEVKANRTPEEVKSVMDNLIASEGYDTNLMKQVKVMPEANDTNLVEIKSTSGESVIVDKEDTSIYLEGKDAQGRKVIWKKKIVSTSYVWFETAKNIAVAFFKLVWNLVSTVAGSLLVGVLDIGKAGVGIVTNTGTGFAQSGKSFWSDIKSAGRRAKEKAIDKNVFYGTI